MKKVTLLAATMSLSTANAAGSAELYRGDASYFRFGVSNKNFAGDEHLVGRLGNQSDTYVELAPNFTLTEVDGTQWDFVSSIAYQAKQSGAWQDLTDNDTTNLAFTQAFLRVSGLFDFDKDAVLWVGKKYNREDSHIVDQYWRNTSGNGVGVENLTLGSGKFSAHWVRQDVKGNDTVFENGQKYAVTNNILDAAYAFPVGPGNLELRYTRSMPQRYSEGRQVKPVNDYENGNLFTVKLGMPVLNGWNNTVLRYGKGGNANWAGATLGNDMANAIYSKTNVSNSYVWDFIDYGAVNFTENFHMVYHVRGTYVNNKTGSKSKMFQAVLRPVYVLTKMTKIMLEPGFYTISYEDQAGNNKGNENISKVTLAYAINPDALNVWTRPEIRFFVTYKHYGHDQKVKVHSTDPSGKDNEFVVGSSNVVYFGAQAEAWF